MPLPLEGVRVLDLTWVYAGPFATRMLAYYGATVVRAEIVEDVPASDDTLVITESHADAPRAGAPVAAGSIKTIAWESRGCVFVDIDLELAIDAEPAHAAEPYAIFFSTGLIAVITPLSGSSTCRCMWWTDCPAPGPVLVTSR